MEQLAADIPSDLADVDETLTRYGRWAMHRHHKRTCGSAEGAYRAPANDDDRQPREIVMATQDALRVQRALARVARPAREVLAILYVPQRLPVAALMRIARIPPRTSRERHIAGLRQLDNLLRHCYTMRAPDHGGSDSAA